MSIFTLAFWKAAGERAIKTAAQTFGGYLIVGPAADIDWSIGVQAAGIAALLSVATSIASNQVGDPGPSLTNEVTLIKGLE